eukprot:m.253057 g.253057  ORF g.253057 m.253057 type:complete len:663 (+) comp17530_c0_seq3:32-2020(+)
MGLLSDPKNQQKLLYQLLIHHRKLIYALLTLSFLGWAALPLDQVSQGDHVQENAMQASLKATTSFDKLLEEEVKALAAELHQATDAQRMAAISRYWQQHHLQPQTQDFNYSGKHATNLFTILRSQRGDGAESVILHAAFASHDGEREANVAGVALAVVTARHFADLPFWHKDVVVVVTPDEAGTRSFVEMLMSSNLYRNVHIESSVYTFGAPQAALSIKSQRDYFTHLELELHGYNGLMPNYDMVMAAKLAANNLLVIPSTEEFMTYMSTPSAIDRYLHSFNCLLKSMTQMMHGLPSGDHAPFLSANIPAFTIRLTTADISPKFRKPLAKAGSLLEALFRRLNNLGQRFNLSFTFYLPVGLRRIVSIGRYLGPVAALLLAGAVQAVVLWWQAGGDDAVLIESQKKPAVEESKDANGKEDKHDNNDIDGTGGNPDDCDIDDDPNEDDEALNDNGHSDEATETDKSQEETQAKCHEPAPLPWSPDQRVGLPAACQQLVLSVAVGSLLVLFWDSLAAMILTVDAKTFSTHHLAQHPWALLPILAFLPFGFAFPQHCKAHSFVTLVHAACLLVPVMFLNAPLAMMAAMQFLVPVILDLHLNLSSFTAVALLVTSPLAYVAALGFAAGSLEVWMLASTGQVTQQVLVLGLVGVPVHWMLCNRAAGMA